MIYTPSVISMNARPKLQNFFLCNCYIFNEVQYLYLITDASIIDIYLHETFSALMKVASL